MAGEQMKQCLICLEVLPIEAFPSKGSGKTGGPTWRCSYCKTCNSAKRRGWRAANRARANAQAAAYIAANPDKRKQWTAAYREVNREVLAAAQRSYRLRNPAQHTQAEARRRAIKMAAKIGDQAAVRRIYQRCASHQEIPCAYCGKVTFCGRRHVEHRTPLVRGGLHAIENLAISCPSCNLRKGSLTADEFAGEV